MNFYPIFLREMLIFRRRLFQLSYLVSSMITPLLYLVAFGLGLGRGKVVDGVAYLSFLVPGIVAMSSMTNSYTWIASSISIGRLYFKTFDEFQVCPVTPSAVMVGELLSGVVRGLFASGLVLIAALVFGAGFPQSWSFLFVWVLNCLIFSALGVVAGFLSKSHEDTATFSNFFILPMAFFCGTFFPIDNLPYFIKTFLYVLPLSHASRSLRAAFLGQEIEPVSVAVMVAFFLMFYGWGIVAIRRSNR